MPLATVGCVTCCVLTECYRLDLSTYSFHIVQWVQRETTYAGQHISHSPQKPGSCPHKAYSTFWELGATHHVLHFLILCSNEPMPCGNHVISIFAHHVICQSLTTLKCFFSKQLDPKNNRRSSSLWSFSQERGCILHILLMLSDLNQHSLIFLVGERYSLDR